MSSITLTPDIAPAVMPKSHYANVRTTVMSWLFTVDHKRIAILYLISITVFFAVGGLFASLIRIELLTPKGDFMTGDTYNKVFTLHGVIMIFFFLIPSVPATLGNFALPIMIGAKDLAFPKINLLSWWLYMLGGVLAVVVLLRGGLETGWTFYPPYSTTFATSQVTIAILAAFLAGFSSIFTGLNFIVTVHKMRAPGMTWFRMPLFVWAHYATSIIQILGTPVVAITLVLVAIERVWGVGIFNPQIGGDPILFQHLFWFYSHPAVYVMILPGMGVVSEVIPCFSRKRIFGYEFIAFSSMAIAIIGFLVWGHHLYVSTQSTYAGMVFSLLTFLVAVPSAIKVFNWTATMYKGEITFEAPMIYALGFIGLFLVGGLTGLVLASMANDIHFHDTYFVVAHFHYVMVGGMVMAYMCGLHFWWPKMTGRMYPGLLATIAAILVFVGFNFTFFPQFILGFLGMPRRYHSYVEEFQILNIMSTMGASVLGLGYGMQPFYLLWSLFKGEPAGDNPWRAKGLEWQVPSPPPTFNFPDGRPVVIEDPYAYTIDVKEADSVAQH
ncbi:MAG: cbb3-type cytochrome c oxidase subunit I [Candidatus Hydrogenedentes bacterium]|nr:cbb3-type cytochrome c oxidase subunit I [Candidatus Hydrogenedentota bacterium]